MNDRIKSAFAQVQAGEELKDKTREILVNKTGGYAEKRMIFLQGRTRFKPVVSAALCLLLLVFGGHWFYFTPTAKISIDVNPSLELGINRFDRVVVVEAYNEDGQELAASLDIRFMGYKEAVSRILENEKVVALLSQDEIMTITVMESKRDQSTRILSAMESCVAKHQNAYCYFADSREVAPAHDHGMSCGKYRAFLELQKLCPDITPEEIQGMTMREIRDLTDKLPEEEGEHHHGKAGTGEGESDSTSKTEEISQTAKTGEGDEKEPEAESGEHSRRSHHGKGSSGNGRRKGHGHD
ncbi:MAG: hypothetical protein HFG54_11580 [Lachnospiraceae bacterium]|jgi:hypothetical protein|nr:hypothetical protein [Lachnospiraceae bacterium]